MSFLVILVASGCASAPHYTSPPTMPVPLSPDNHAEWVNGQPMTFQWQRTDNTEYYEFHIFNAETSDINEYMKTALRPEQVCRANTCSLTLSVDLPASVRHAWRVRSGNHVGLSTWTRNLFAIKAL